MCQNMLKFGSINKVVLGLDLGQKLHKINKIMIYLKMKR